ncbi:hypothetical protein NUU61_004710 [Penicillium alfredii]|uniref:Uncharacterized protein n=1 Tax=Penicillium alfredii TaxID=1506179 RepID=A0A9W9K6X6_9EURO|nr:uncharacterized protein NUU61_004710 [Penicillium alfredii]KAJ5095354.1 hypothetical protein NUU61_004710 [Penicillium alfredii]
MATTQVHRLGQELKIVDQVFEPQIITLSALLRVRDSSIGKEIVPGASDTRTKSLALELPSLGRFVSRVGQNIQSVKSRLWKGIIPLSEQRWLEKGLNEPAQFDMACQHVSAVLAAFEYLNQPPVAKSLRDAFKLVWKHWSQAALPMADYAIWLDMHVYHGRNAPLPGLRGSALRTPDFVQRQRLYVERLRQLTRLAIYESTAGGRGDLPYTLHQTALDQIASQNQLRRELRALSPIRGYGLVIYRLTHSQSNTEWPAFVEKLEAHVADWGRGQTGCKAIQPYLKLHWLDGEALGISEGDCEAARKSTTAVSLHTQTSHIQPPPIWCLPGDFAGFVLTIDATYKVEKSHQESEASPEYPGQMRILVNLVWGDLHALLRTQSSSLESLWPLAREHPNYVYVGPTVPLQLCS